MPLKSLLFNISSYIASLSQLNSFSKPTAQWKPICWFLCVFKRPNQAHLAIIPPITIITMTATYSQKISLRLHQFLFSINYEHKRLILRHRIFFLPSAMATAHNIHMTLLMLKF